MGKQDTTVNKLVKAIKMKTGITVLYGTSQFLSHDTGQVITMYNLKIPNADDRQGHHSMTELFRSASQIQIVLFLRDYLYILENKPLPMDNEKWNLVRIKLKEKGESIYG